MLGDDCPKHPAQSSESPFFNLLRPALNVCPVSLQPNFRGKIDECQLPNYYQPSTFKKQHKNIYSMILSKKSMSKFHAFHLRVPSKIRLTFQDTSQRSKDR